jgi:hypothetical protein
MTPSRVMDDPTIPVAAANIVAVEVTARYREPLSLASKNWKALKRRLIKPELSRMYPINKKKGTADRTVSVMTPKNWSVIR